MSAHVLLNLLNKLRKSDKMQGLPSIYRFFATSNTEAQMLDSIYHVTLELFKNCIVGVKTPIFCHLLCNIIMDVITLCYLICKPPVV